MQNDRKSRDADETGRFVGRGGVKLQAALDAFRIDVKGRLAADLGSHIGGFVDCLLQNGAAKVYSVDTSYGTLAWRLRQDPRVVVLERQNAIHVRLPERVDLVTIDVGWTPQKMVLPNARKLIREGPPAQGPLAQGPLAQGARIITLVKPQYEAHEDEREKGVVKPDRVEAVLSRVIQELSEMGIEAAGCTESPLRGEGGNREFFLLI